MNSLQKYYEMQEAKKFEQQRCNKTATNVYQKFIPMLMSTDMVNAIENDTKTETRRTISYNKKIENPKIGFSAFSNKNQFEVRGIHENGEYGSSFFNLKAKKGDIIWVRETWQITDFLNPLDENYGYIYKASENGLEWQHNMENWKWKPSIYMPKKACRLFLEVTNVKIEKLQDITEESAIKEGVLQFSKNTFEDYIDTNMYLSTAKISFQTLWQKINGIKSWEINPYVFVYQFKKVEKPLNFLN